MDAAEVLPLFFGGNLEKERQKHIQGSPLYWVTPDSAPTLCVHGTKDQYVAFEQAEWIVDRLKATGWRPQVAFDQGLAETVTWYREHESWWRPIKDQDPAFRKYYQAQYGSTR